MIDAVTVRSMLVLPGGGYGALADHEGVPVAEWLTAIGWRARVVRYPVLTRHPGPLDVVRAEIEAERRAGAQVVGVLGFSAGGHLAGHTALAPDSRPEQRPDLAVLCYPVVSMVAPTHGYSRDNLLGEGASAEARAAASLELLVTPSSPPMFLWHTAADEAVPVGEHPYVLAAALAGAGVAHELHVFSEGVHGIGLAPGEPAAAWTGLCESWLTRVAPATA